MAYTVTIKRQRHGGIKDALVAIDENGDWRTYCRADEESLAKSGRELAVWLFHAEEVGEVSVNANGETVVQVFEFKNGQPY